MADINAAIFDFGGVLTTSPTAGINVYEDSVGIERGALLRIVTGDSVEGDDPWHRLERGELDAREFWFDVRRRVFEELGFEISLRELTASFAEGFRIRDEIVNVVRELSGKAPLALLTNNVKEFGAVWKSMVPVDELFDTIVDSSDVGMRKPDHRIYRITLEQMGAEPEETVFVDDTLENVEAAEVLGMTGIHFGDDVSEDDVVRRLRELLAHRL